MIECRLQAAARSAGINWQGRAKGARSEKEGGAVRLLVGRPRRGNNRIPGNRARRAGLGAFAAEVRVSALQLLQSDTNPCSNRKHVRARTCFRGPSLCLNQTPYPRASKACYTCLSTAEDRSPDALATPEPIGLPKKNQKSVSSYRIAVTTFGDGSLVGEGKRRTHARDRLFWDIR